jgi:phenylalanyl-tRNA synthetase beta chain
MNIKISDNWLREYVKTPATIQEMAQALSLCSVGVERIEKTEGDVVYDIEVTTNRPDLMSVIGIAREASAVLPQFGIEAEFIPLKTSKIYEKGEDISKFITIKSDKSLVHRILAVVLDVSMKQSPEKIKRRLTMTDIRSLNALVDVTNYVMREVGHPAHVFDYDRLSTKKLVIRKSKEGEVVTTLDKKQYSLPGGDIVAENGNGEIIDLIGIMGTENSVVTDSTKRILFFLDNNNPDIIRKTSMKLGIRTEAAILNEKSVDPELMYTAFLRGVELYKEIANATVVSSVLDIYPTPPKDVLISANTEKIRSVIGVPIPNADMKKILHSLGFTVTLKNDTLEVFVPSFRHDDVTKEEDIIEEIARVYGYHNIPSTLPPQNSAALYHQDHDPFYWEKKVKTSLQNWGFNEVYTYSTVSGKMIEGTPESFLALKNPLDSDHIYLRQSLIPSLLEVIDQNSFLESLKIFEIANVYLPKKGSLPDEIPYLAGVVKDNSVSFSIVKGYITALLKELGIHDTDFVPSITTDGADIYKEKLLLGTIEILSANSINFELNFNVLLSFSNAKKQYRPIHTHPPIIEDITIEFIEEPVYKKIIDVIQSNSTLIKKIELINTYENRKTFRISYQHTSRTLTNEEISTIRTKINLSIQQKLKGKVI